MEDKTLATTPPPPPSEVKIRTMRSDIESMMQSGGGAPSFKNVSVEGLSLEKKYKAPVKFVMTPMPTAAPVQAPPAAATPPPATTPVQPSAPAPGRVAAPVQPQTEKQTLPQISIEAAALETPPEASPDESPKSSFIPVLIVTLVALLALAVVGYFAYTLFIK